MPSFSMNSIPGQEKRGFLFYFGFPGIVSLESCRHACLLVPRALHLSGIEGFISFLKVFLQPPDAIFLARRGNITEWPIQKSGFISSSWFCETYYLWSLISASGNSC